MSSITDLEKITSAARTVWFGHEYRRDRENLAAVTRMLAANRDLGQTGHLMLALAAGACADAPLAFPALAEEIDLYRTAHAGTDFNRDERALLDEIIAARSKFLALAVEHRVACEVARSTISGLCARSTSPVAARVREVLES